jgi:phage tail protein X
MQYESKQGDMLDAVCHAYYKGRSGATEAVLDANPGLAKLGPVLPLGTLIELPDLAPVESVATVSLWD